MNIASLIQTKPNRKIPLLAPGDTVKVHNKIVEGGKERIQVFQGVVIRIKSGGNGASFTVRHVAYGIGVERTFPYLSPRVEKVEIMRHGKVRRAKLYYLRERSGKAARLKEKRIDREKLRLENVIEETEEPVVAEEAPEEIAPPEAELSEPTQDESPEQPVAEAAAGAAEEPKAEGVPETAEPVAEEVKAEIQEVTEDQAPEEAKAELPEETGDQPQEEAPEEKKD